jgi:hypothetical protein
MGGAGCSGLTVVFAAPEVSHHLLSEPVQPYSILNGTVKPNIGLEREALPVIQSVFD